MVNCEDERKEKDQAQPPADPSIHPDQESLEAKERLPFVAAMGSGTCQRKHNRKQQRTIERKPQS